MKPSLPVPGPTPGAAAVAPVPSRRELLAAGTGAALLLLLPPKAAAAAPRRPALLDPELVARMADRDPALRPPLLVDIQTHIWWRAGGVKQMSEEARRFASILEGNRAYVTGRPVHLADMGRLMFIEDTFLNSETDLAFLNSFGMKGSFDGIDLFPPREAVAIRRMAPARIRVHGTVDPPDGKAAVDSLRYQCETLKIDSLKLYPPGFVPDRRFWRMDDEKLTYPLLEVMRKHGLKNVCVHTGHMGRHPLGEMEPCVRAPVLAKAAADFPDLNFIAFHACWPWEAELADLARKAKVKNLYAELGGLARLMIDDPIRYAHMIGTLVGGLGADHVLWGTDTPLWGPPHWQIQYFQAMSIPEELIAQHGYPQLTWADKLKILGENTARLYGLELAATRSAIEGDVLYRLREDKNPLPLTIDPRDPSQRPRRRR